MGTQFSEIPMMEDLDKLTNDAGRKYKRFMELVQAWKAELEQIQAAIVEKIAVHENVITNLMGKEKQSIQNALAIQSNLDMV